MLGPLEHVQPIIAAIAMHGLVDVTVPHRIPVYALAAIPLQGKGLSGIFLFASINHLSNDLNIVISIIFHLVLILYGAMNAYDAAMAILMTYMAIVHLPLLFLRHDGAHRLVLVAALVAGACGGHQLLERLGMVEDNKERKTRMLVLPPLAQRIVVCHAVACLLFPSN